MTVRIKKLHPEAIIPKYTKDGDAGLDLVAVSREKDQDSDIITYGTGLSIEIPDGYVGLVVPRSSIYKTINRQANCVGIIDSGYRGEIMIKHDYSTDHTSLNSSLEMVLLNDKLAPSLLERLLEDVESAVMYEVGDRVAQLIIMPYPRVQFVEVKGELSSSERGEGGFGSTGR